jgi:hypothetical protein
LRRERVEHVIAGTFIDTVGVTVNNGDAEPVCRNAESFNY